MFSVGVRDHILVAHSLPGEVFGPAQRLHGATYTVSAELEGPELSSAGIVIDIGLFQQQLRAVLSDLDYRNLDDHTAFQAKPSTTERIAQHVHGELCARLPPLKSATLAISLDESPVAWARYRAPLEATTARDPPSQRG